MKVLKGSPIPYTIPDDIEDDMTNTRREYSWLHDRCYTEEPDLLMQRYLEDPEERLAYVGPDDKLHINGHRGCEVMEDMKYINERLCFLYDQVNSQGIRGTSLADLRISNGSRRRNHHRHHGRTRHILQYTKTTNNREMDIFLPILMAPAIQHLDEMYLVLLRPMEAILAYALWGKQSYRLYREFMFVQMGHRFTESMLYRQFPDMAEKYFGVNLSLSEYRKWAIAVMREYIPPEYLPEHRRDTVGDRMGQHSTSIARGIYSNLEGNLPYLTTDAMWYYDEFCERWQDISGFGENAMPSPLKLLRRKAGSSSSSTTTTTAVAAAATTSIPVEGSRIEVMFQTIMNKIMDLERRVDMQDATVGAQLQVLRQELTDDTKRMLAQGLATLHGPSAIAGADATASTTVAVSSSLAADAVSANSSSSTMEDVISTNVNSADTALLEAPEDDFDSMYISDVDISMQDMDHPFGSSKGVDDRSLKDMVLDELGRDDMEWNALQTMRNVLEDPKAYWRSNEQRDTVLEALTMTHNLVSVMKTGAGKSMTWIIPALMQLNIRTVVVVPYHHLLDQQLTNAMKMGCKAMRWTTKSGLIGDHNLIFVALETAAAAGFKRYEVLHHDQNPL